MAKKPPEKVLGTRKRLVVETSAASSIDPDAWPKFEELIRRAAKMGHKPHKLDGKRKVR